MQQNWTLSVSQLNEYVRVQLASDPVLRELSVRGEISGLKRAASGHLYFLLKDETARVQCVMFRQSAIGLEFIPADGMKVVVRGSASLFVRDGAYQIYVDSMQQQGLGDLYRQFLLLKERLAQEGLFDPALKRELPEIPRCVGIATSESGAVLHDILRVGWARWPNMHFMLAPCSVQGPQAAQEIVRALAMLNRYGCDVILCGRGGGSLEDLWPFNEEIVARAIRASRAPVVSCVGHETDFTIADFAADARAATPSNAAEIAIPNRREYAEELRGMQDRLQRGALSRIETCRTEVHHLAASFALKNPTAAWMQPRRAELDALKRRLQAAAQAKERCAQVDLAVWKTKLEALRPGAPLKRGYALIERDGAPVERAAQIGPGERIAVWMQDGGFRAEAVEWLEGSVWEHAKEKGTDV